MQSTLSEKPTITVKGYPGALAYDSGKGEIYVVSVNPNFDSDTISVISDSSNTVVANVTVGSLPSDIAYDSAKGEVFVANSLSDSISVISDSSGTATSYEALILVAVIVVVVVFCVIALALRKSIRVHFNSKQTTK